MIVEYGKWGINNTVLQENYVKCSFTLVLHERWYLKKIRIIILKEKNEEK